MKTSQTELSGEEALLTITILVLWDTVNIVSQRTALINKFVHSQTGQKSPCTPRLALRSDSQPE